MTALTVNGSAVAATTLAAAGKLFNTTGGTSGSTSKKVGSGTLFKQIFALGTSTNQTGVASIPAPTDAGWHGWMWDVTTLEGQEIAEGTWTPTIHLLASTSTTVTPTVQWFKRSSAGVYTSIGSVAGSSIALTTSSQLLVFTAPSLPLMDFATGDKLMMWLWVNQTAGGATNSTISVVEATSGSSAGVASEAQTVTPGYAPIPVALSVTIPGVGALSPTLSAKVALSTTMSGVGMSSEGFRYGTAIYGTAIYGGAFSLNTALTDTLVGIGTLSGTLSTTGGSVSLIVTMSGVGTLSGTTSLATHLTSTIAGVGLLSPTLTANLALPSVTLPGVGTLSGTLAETTALTATLAGVGTLTGTLSTTAGVSLSVTMAGIGTLAGTLSANTALSTTLVGVGTLTGTTSLTTALSTTLAGVGTLTGTLSANTALSTTLAGAGTLAGTMALSTALGCQLIGTGTLTGVFSARVALSLTFAGAGMLTASLTAQAPTIQFPTATWVTRDGKTSWVTRDEQATWDARDDLATWKAR